MKKITFFVGALTLTSTLFAQDLQSKKGENFLPEAKDWALGIDAVPFLNYFGNFIGGDGLNVAPNWNYMTNNNSIVGKYFVDDKMAYRGSLRIGFGSNTERMTVADRAADNTFLNYPNPVPTKENTMKSAYNAIGLAGGLEWRKGSTRLQGYYGGELGFMISGGKDTYTYGNALTENASTFNPLAIDVNIDAADDFGSNIVTYESNAAYPARVLESKSSSFGLGLRGFIGVEYFIVPKLSIGGEFGWGLGLMSSNSSMRIEAKGIDNFSGLEVRANHDIKGNKTNSFGFDTDIMNTVFGNAGQLKITFHF
jgi:hypothetical protein